MSNKRWLANGLIGLGAILILVVIGYFGWSQVSASRLRAELRAAPVNASSAASAPAATPASPAALAVEAAASPSGAPTAAPTRAPTAAPTAVPTAVPTNAPTAAPTEAKPAPIATTQAAAAAPAAPAATATKAAPATKTAAATAKPANTATRQPTRKPAATAKPGQPTAVPAAARIEPVRLAIPDLKLDAKVVPMTWQVVNTAKGPVSEWVIPKNEGGHHINSAYLGEAGNLVISGHNNIYARVFLNISQAWDDATRVKVDNFTDRSEILTGRRLRLYDAAGNAREYAITAFYRVRDTGVPQEQRVKNGRFMLPVETEQVTIITCWPPTNNTHRLVVIAEPVQ